MAPPCGTLEMARKQSGSCRQSAKVHVSQRSDADPALALEDKSLVESPQPLRAYWTSSAGRVAPKRMVDRESGVDRRTTRSISRPDCTFPSPRKAEGAAG